MFTGVACPVGLDSGRYLVNNNLNHLNHFRGVKGNWYSGAAGILKPLFVPEECVGGGVGDKNELNLLLESDFDFCNYSLGETLLILLSSFMESGQWV